MFELMPFDRRSDRLMTRFFDEFANSCRSAQPMGFSTDIRDNGDTVVLEAELPGFAKEDISVSLENDVLTVSAERAEQTEDKRDGYIRRERRTGSFRRSFDVTGIDAENIKAAYNNGVLSLELPKLREVAPEARKIEIQ